MALVLGHDALSAGQKRVFAHGPLLVAAELDDGDVADGRRREEQLAGACVGGFRHFAADEDFLKGEFYGAFEGYGGGHGNHGTWGS